MTRGRASALVVWSVVVAVSACSDRSPASEASERSITPAGFATIAATVTASDGEVCELCVWMAATQDERARGLMGVTDLGGADGMAFLYDGPVTNRFYMYGTVMPLSIAFVDAAGTVVSTTDMEPCQSPDPSACPRHAPSRPYVAAIEAPRGRLAALGLVPGASVRLAGECVPESE